MESATSSIIPAITRSATTAHMIFLSSSNLVSLYPSSTECASALSRTPILSRQISGSLAMKGMFWCLKNSCRRSWLVASHSARLPWNSENENSSILHVDHYCELEGHDFYAFWLSWNIFVLFICFPRPHTNVISLSFHTGAFEVFPSSWHPYWASRKSTAAHFWEHHQPRSEYRRAGPEGFLGPRTSEEMNLSFHPPPPVIHPGEKSTK